MVGSYSPNLERKIMTDKQLQRRAGRNIGIESMPVFIQAAGAPEEVVPTSGSQKTVLAGVPTGLRTPFTCETNGYAFNTDAASVNYLVFFEDSLGNQMCIGGGTVAAATADQMGWQTFNGNDTPFTPQVPLCLAEGEKIIITAVPTPPLV